MSTQHTFHYWAFNPCTRAQLIKGDARRGLSIINNHIDLSRLCTRICRFPVKLTPGMEGTCWTYNSGYPPRSSLTIGKDFTELLTFLRGCVLFKLNPRLHGIRVYIRRLVRLPAVCIGSQPTIRTTISHSTLPTRSTLYRLAVLSDYNVGKTALTIQVGVHFTIKIPLNLITA